MKKIILMAGLVIAGMTVNAQFYVGGSLGIGTNSESNKDGKKVGTSEVDFSIAPEVGYALSEKMDVGLFFNFGSNTRNDYSTPDNVGRKTTTTEWGVSPYVRYSFISFGKLDLRGRLALNLSGGSTEVDNNGTKNERSFSAFGASIVPLVLYNLSDKFALYTQLNFLGVDFESNKVKDGNTTTTFNFGVDTDNVATLGNVRLGFVYKF